ncbi:MAG TPA: IclR family transcriptional regulator [Pseudonocardiaceae bacterium]|jgi:DNA-binding IclR family transcriptional regulator|nr:IclR family transcriptional regulator [Pseudonocardiaceae bacterium]
MKKTSADITSGPGLPAPPQYPIESVDNALKLLLLLGERSELRLTEVAEYLDVASSTAHRLLAMLQYRGFMRQDPQTKVYRAGTSLTGVAFAILQRFDVRETLRPFLERLNEQLAETVHVAMLDGSTVRFIDAIESPQAVRVASRLGKSMPAHCTSSGKAMLSLLSTAELHRLYPQEDLVGLTTHSLRTRTALEADLARSARRGYATSDEESEPGVGSVAVAFPLRQTPMRLAINVSVPINRLPKADVRRIAAAVQATVTDAAALLH